MMKITKEMCVVFLKDYYESKIASQAIISIFVVIALWVFSENIFVIITAALTLVTLCIMQGIKIKDKIRNVCPEDFYLEEDVVVDFKKRLRLGRNTVGRDYIYTFNKYGKHTISLRNSLSIEIPLDKERNNRWLAVDRLSSESGNKGDLFYLLICEDDGKKKIVQCFYQHYYDVEKVDFDYIDGKYYCNYLNENNIPSEEE